MLLVLFAASALAAEPVHLSVDEAIARLEAQNPSVRRADAAVDGADAANLAALSAILPTLVGTGSYTRNNAEVTLDLGQLFDALAEAEARASMARAQADAALASASATKHAGAASREASRAAKAQAAALTVQRENAERQADRLESLGQDVSTVQRESARTAADGLSKQVAGAGASTAASVVQAAAAEDQSRAAASQADAASEAVKAAEATLQRARLSVAECSVKAPSNGYVETLPWQVGELVQGGAILARLVDISEVKATFYLPNAEVTLDLGQLFDALAAMSGQPPSADAPGVITLQPLDAFSGAAALKVPLVSASAWAGISAAHHGQDAAQARRRWG